MSNTQRNPAYSQLNSAIWEEDFDRFRALIENGVEANDTEGVDPPLLVLAAHFGLTQFVRLLIEAGTDFNKRSLEEGWAALHRAAWRDTKNENLNHRRTEVARCLLDAGADINIRTSDGRTPLMCAAEHAHVAMVELLIAAGADLWIENDAGRCALDRAYGDRIALESYHAEVRIVMRLYEAMGMDIGSTAWRGETIEQYFSSFGVDAAQHVRAKIAEKRQAEIFSAIDCSEEVATMNSVVNRKEAIVL